MPAGRKTIAGRPRPRARARLAHEPEPEPEKQAEADREGTRLAGQGEPGNESQTPFATATARTQAVLRATRTPGSREAARKTRRHRDGTRDLVA